jgi:hypothetical protein
MKKLLTTAAFAFVLLTSCTDEDAAPTTPVTEDVFVTQLTETIGGATNVYAYSYDGNKILSAIGQGGVEVLYTYTNGFMVREDRMVNGVATEYFIYTYTIDSKLAQAIHVANNDLGVLAGKKTRYFYNNDGTIGTLVHTGTPTAQNTLLGSGTVTMVNNNIASYSFVYDDDDTIAENNISEVKTMTYSNGKAAMRNVFAYDALCLARLEGGVNTLASVETKVVIPATEVGEEDDETVTTVSYTYQYNENNYPTSQTGGNVSRQYTYN